MTFETFAARYPGDSVGYEAGSTDINGTDVNVFYPLTYASYDDNMLTVSYIPLMLIGLLPFFMLNVLIMMSLAIAAQFADKSPYLSFLLVNVESLFGTDTPNQQPSTGLSCLGNYVIVLTVITLLFTLRFLCSPTEVNNRQMAKYKII